MKQPPTREQELQWMQQWRNAAVALDEVKRDELANMTDEEAWHKSERLLSLASFYRQPTQTSGLVQQQALFHKRRSK